MNSENFIEKGSIIIQGMIDDAIKQGKNEITIVGNYLINKSIVIPSDFTIILDRCHLRLEDNTYCQIFINTYVSNINEGYSSRIKDRGISIIGKNGAILDGGNYNGLSEKNWKEKGHYIAVNNVILFANLEKFNISGIKIINQRWWAINLINCSFGKVRDIEFCSNYMRLLPDGTLTSGLLANDYSSVYVKNSDGVDIRLGSHDIEVENITGFTEDDTVAVTALLGELESRYASDRQTNEIYNIKIKNVRASAYCTLVRVLNQGGTLIHDVSIEEIFDDSGNCRYMDKSFAYAVRVGDMCRYGEGKDVAPENITIKNVFGRQDVVLRLIGDIKNLVYDGIRGYKESQILVQKD